MGDKGSSTIADRWKSHHVLKRDVFSTVERGRFMTPAGEVEAVLRHLAEVPWWSWPLAHLLMSNERRALQWLDKSGVSGIAPPLLYAGNSLLVRGWIEGVPLYIAKPYGDLAYFRSARSALRRLHRCGICHNDLAKEQNWLKGNDGHAYLTDFQLSFRFSRRGRLFRIAAYEDLRHMLKHKRRYAEQALTPAERRILARKSWPTRIWMASGKKIYLWLTRGVLKFADREGGGMRLVRDAPSIETLLKGYPGIREAVVVAYPDRRVGTGLYAFVEAEPALSDRVLSKLIADKLGAPAVPEHLQIVDTLPRRASGEVHKEVLQLIALNQVDSIGPLIASEAERAAAARVARDRRNMGDRISWHS